MENSLTSHEILTSKNTPEVEIDGWSRIVVIIQHKHLDSGINTYLIWGDILAMVEGEEPKVDKHLVPRLMCVRPASHWIERQCSRYGLTVAAYRSRLGATR